MKNTNELTRQRFREALFQTFASEGNSPEKCSEYATNFDKLTDTGMSGDTASAIVYSSFGTQDAKQVQKTISGWVFSELEEFTANHPGVNKNPLVRLRENVKKLNSNLSKCRISVNNVDVSEEMIQRATVKLPGCLTPPTVFQTTASANEKPKFFLEVTF